MMSGWWGAGMALVSLLFWVVIILIIVFLARSFIRNSHSHNLSSSDAEDSAIKILKERYAKGEIDKAEFENKWQISSNIAKNNYVKCGKKD